MLRVLLAEDNSFLADALAKALLRDYQVDIVFDGEMALAQVSKEPYHILLLDVMMPKLTGIQVCRHLRAQGNSIPIVLLTARDHNKEVIGNLIKSWNYAVAEGIIATDTPIEVKIFTTYLQSFSHRLEKLLTLAYEGKINAHQVTQETQLLWAQLLQTWTDLGLGSFDPFGQI